MSAILLQASVLLCLSQSALAAMGHAFATGPVAQGTFIKRATSTLIVPEGNTPFQGILSLWVGMGTDKPNLIQTILDRHPGQGGTICEDLKDINQWCGFSYTLAGDDQIFGPQVAIVAGDHFEYRYEYDFNSGNYTQYGVLNGEVRTTLSTSSGKAQGFGTAIECAANDCGTVPPHQWIKTKIEIEPADPNYGDTAVEQGVTTSGFSSPDGGATWTVDVVNVPEMTFS